MFAARTATRPLARRSAHYSCTRTRPLGRACNVSRLAPPQTSGVRHHATVDIRPSLHRRFASSATEPLCPRQCLQTALSPSFWPPPTPRVTLKAIRELQRPRMQHAVREDPPRHAHCIGCWLQTLNDVRSDAKCVHRHSCGIPGPSQLPSSKLFERLACLLRLGSTALLGGQDSQEKEKKEAWQMPERPKTCRARTALTHTFRAFLATNMTSPAGTQFPAP